MNIRHATLEDVDQLLPLLSELGYPCKVEELKTVITKFGSLIGDGCKVGVNAVLAPGCILKPKTIVKRLTLLDQLQSSP